MGQIIRFPARPTERTFTCDLVAGTKVATPRGWCAVEDVASGERVMTLETGMRMVLHAESRSRAGTMLIHVPSGALGNDGSLLLLPHRQVRRGADGPLVRADGLIGSDGICLWLSRAPVEIVSLQFSEPCSVFANLGAVVASALTSRGTGTGDPAPLIAFRAARSAAQEAARP